MAKLPVLATAQTAYRDTWAARRELMLLATPAVSALSILTVIIMWRLRNGADIGAAILIQIIGFIAFVTPFTVAWLRHLIVNESDGTARAALTWGKQQRRTLAVYLRIIAFSMISSALIQVFALGTADQPTPLILVAPFIAVAVLVANARQFVQLPAEALGTRMSLSDVWKLTDGNGFRLTALLLLATLPTFLPTLIINQVLDGLASALHADTTLTFLLISGIVGHSLQFAGFAVLLAGYAEAFRFFTPKAVAIPD